MGEVPRRAPPPLVPPLLPAAVDQNLCSCPCPPRRQLYAAVADACGLATEQPEDVLLLAGYSMDAAGELQLHTDLKARTGLSAQTHEQSATPPAPH